MGRPVCRHGPLADIGVTVAAAVRAGVVGANIDTDRAVAPWPLSFILRDDNRLPQDFSQQAMIAVYDLGEALGRTGEAWK